ncbi:MULTISPECIES: LysM peptidoglycan-binding domain-containing protein [Paenibacillus]|uniref:Peptidoglycan-binding protein LysM n=2 Tax=Paenibacillus TaxID=44249 RepID=A0ABX2ZF68_PAEPO|nr:MULTISPECIES: LysM domain-containing protein [Paenibacillus]AIW41962.1 peptidoglycan-binding protein LysM [Paenibacillus polymyxa CR1]MDR6778870.1 LysM repeat protein [Paenibacillus peoriae]ODA09638.1 peptidoglycan-binding protein LysM [Paenibacillus polymyxa]ODB58935.1 peptidoglycan-binding protein LysM [Paenibacillus polymyxa]OME67849.1 peptidoglycan-binding protein LysM [Paenibacillus peoriae]
MKNVMKKVAVSSMLAVSLGAVSLLSPLATGQVMAKSNADNNRDHVEEQLIIKQQEEAQKALEAKLFGTETTENAATTTPAQPATENNNQATTTKPATTTTETPATVNTITVNVQEGDTLASIAEKYGVTVEELVKINNLVKVGQELQVPQTNTNK